MELFQAGEFHDAHDAWEELWFDEVGTVKRTLQALIQLAVGFYHRGNDNRRGALKLFRRAGEIFGEVPDDSLGLDIGDLRQRCAALAEEVESGTMQYDSSLVPDFQPALDRFRSEPPDQDSPTQGSSPGD